MDLLCNIKRQNTLHFYASVRLPTVWYAGYLLTLLNGWPLIPNLVKSPIYPREGVGYDNDKCISTGLSCITIMQKA